MSINKIRKLSNLKSCQWNKKSLKYVDLSQHKLLDKKQALEDLTIIKKVFDKNEVNFWLVGGTLLGVIRDDDFISIDDDIDVAVYEEEFLLKFNELKEDFMLEGFIFRNVKKALGTKINLYRFDVFNTQKSSIDGLVLKNKYRYSRTKRYPKKYFEKYGTIDFKGISFRVPSPPEKYLSTIYIDWRTPVKSKANEKKWRNRKIFWNGKL